MTDPKTLSSFLTRFSEDPELQKRYQADPEGTLRAEGLDAEQSEAVLSGDETRVRSLLPEGDATPIMILAAEDGTDSTR